MRSSQHPIAHRIILHKDIIINRPRYDIPLLQPRQILIRNPQREQIIPTFREIPQEYLHPLTRHKHPPFKIFRELLTTLLTLLILIRLLQFAKVYSQKN
jgi:hypothetical protein